MKNQNTILNHNSILYRCTQKYYDKQLSPYHIGSGQMQFLLLVYENEGISMQQLAKIGAFDKGTVTKGVQKLEETGYLVVENDKIDKRVKCLYTTDLANSIVPKMYEIRREWYKRLTLGLTVEELDLLEEKIAILAENAQKYTELSQSHLQIYGLQKLTLLDYPGKMACTLFTGGCNFRCPFCHNRDLVFLPENMHDIPEEEINSFLDKRQQVLEGICVSGGEPLLHPSLEEFLCEVKEKGYHVKLDTNGSFPERLHNLIEAGLVDYVAMDVKNGPSVYGKTVGLENLDLSSIKKSVDTLMQGKIPYEFRCTVVKEFHDESSIKELGEWIHGAKRLYLQNFEDNDQVIQKGLHACSLDELKHFQSILRQHVQQVEIRGL